MPQPVLRLAAPSVRAVFDGPAKFIDTSRNYGDGRSEERIGAVIRERGGLPQGVVLATKLDRDMETNRFSAARARRSLEESLKALGLTEEAFESCSAECERYLDEIGELTKLLSGQ